MRARTARPAAVAALGLLLGACGTAGPAAVPSPSPSPSPSLTTVVTETTADTGSTELGPADRPARLVAPEERTGLAPLLVLLHGYGSTAAEHDRYLGVTAEAASRGLYVLLPDGTPEPSGKRFWDASPACCNFTGTPVDDVGYLSDLIDEAIAERPIDPDRLYLFGHSNGGFMAYRMACDAGDHVTAIAVLAGAELPDVDDCAPTRPVSVLHLHGTADPLITYEGGALAAPFPGAEESVSRWATRDGCTPGPASGDPIDLDATIDGTETTVLAYDGCDEGTAAQLDSISGGRHSPALTRDAVGRHVLDWLLERTR